jgi:hypothetical protein
MTWQVWHEVVYGSVAAVDAVGLSVFYFRSGGIDGETVVVAELYRCRRLALRSAQLLVVYGDVLPTPQELKA